MSSLATNGSGNDHVKWGRIPGQREGGVILDFKDVQARSFEDKNKLKTYDDGNPIMDTIVTCEQPDGTKRDLYISGKRMKNAVRDAFRAVGRTDLGQYDVLYVTFTDYDGNAREFVAEYTVFDPTAQAA